MWTEFTRVRADVRAGNENLMELNVILLAIVPFNLYSYKVRRFRCFFYFVRLQAIFVKVPVIIIFVLTNK